MFMLIIEHKYLLFKVFVLHSRNILLLSCAQHYKNCFCSSSTIVKPLKFCNKLTTILAVSLTTVKVNTAFSNLTYDSLV